MRRAHAERHDHARLRGFGRGENGVAERSVVGNVVVRCDDDGNRVRIFLRDRDDGCRNGRSRIAYAGLEENLRRDADVQELGFDRVRMLNVADYERLCRREGRHPQHSLLEHGVGAGEAQELLGSRGL